MRLRLVPSLAALMLFAVAIASVAAVRFRSDPSLELPRGASGGPRFGLSTVGLSFPFAAAIAKGFAEAAARAGAQAVILDAKGDVQKQANDVQDLVQQRVAGIAIMPLDSVVARGWVDRSASAGVPTVAVAALVGDPHKRQINDVYPKLAALVSQDEVAAGAAAGRLSLGLLPKDHVAKIAIIEGAAGFPEVEQRARGFRQALDAGGARYRIIASQPGNWTSEKGEAACQNILAGQPDIDLFFNEADDMVVGCARAVRSAGSKARLVGIGGSKLAIASIKAGAVDGTVCFKPEALGSLAFGVLHDVESRSHPHRAEFLTYPIPAVTRTNVDECMGQW